MSDDIVVAGASGVSGRNIARRLHERGLPLVLAARDRGRLDEMAESLPGSRVIAGDIDALTATLGAAALVVNTVGPFSTRAQPVRQACLHRGIPYLDIANEHVALEQLVALDLAARRRGIPMLSAVGFGPSVAEALLTELTAEVDQPPQRVRIVTAPAGEVLSAGLQATFTDAIARGATWLQDGGIRMAPFGSGAATVRLGEATRQVVPAPTADIIAAQRVTKAPNVIAYFATPGAHQPAGEDSYVYVEAEWSDGVRLGRQARLGNGNQASADIVAETIARMLATDRGAIAGAWTAVELFGPTVVFDATTMEVVDADPRQVWADTGGEAA
jgi:hypothetical protein